MGLHKHYLTSREYISLKKKRGTLLRSGENSARGAQEKIFARIIAQYVLCLKAVIPSSSSIIIKSHGLSAGCVRCQFHQLPPTSSVRRHLAQFLKRHPAPLDDVV